MSLGGLSEVMEVDEAVQNFCDAVKWSVERKTNQTYDVFVAKTYRSQVVSGLNYFIKVHVGGDEYIHLRVYEPPRPLALHGVLESKTQDSTIDYFEQNVELPVTV
ncbi:hypothetical protein NHX12_016647 [Muraenolepis orangiensis]|uniref:Cystatin-B n=1 Tax=Muraenolepis orangiensis TaxID=630683 RepID=A0A9Q0D758_9TELE|nr:hypothetical protein NHX12_016647 [Muraenolepis orangiensis]